MMSHVDEITNHSTCVADAGTRSCAHPSSLIHHPSPIFSWYPMYVSYCQELKVRDALEKEGVKCFLPMVQKTARVGKKLVHSVEPAIHNLIFVYSHRDQLRDLKMFNRDCSYMQFMTIHQRSDAQSSVVITVPDHQMEQFIRAMSIDDPDGQRTYLPYSDFLGKEGKRVRFIRGAFEGIEGTIKRINKNRHLVITLPHVGVLVISIPSISDLEIL